MGSNEGIRKPPKRRRPRMRVILPQPYMIFRFQMRKDYDYLNVDPASLSEEEEEEEDACSEAQKPLNKPKTESYFDCNLCFKSEWQPVVTACGHLYCYSCLCDWLKFDRKCPVCEAEVVDGRIFPIYQCTGVKPKPKTQLV